MDWFIGYLLVGLVMWCGMAIEDGSVWKRQGWAVYLYTFTVCAFNAAVAWPYVALMVIKNDDHRTCRYSQLMKLRRQSDFELYGC